MRGIIIRLVVLLSPCVIAGLVIAGCSAPTTIDTSSPVTPVSSDVDADHPFIVPSASMEPTLEPGSRVTVDKLIYRSQDPAFGDVVVFEYPPEPAKEYIKRIIGIPGDTIRLESGILFRNEEQVIESYILKPIEDVDYPHDGQNVVIPDGQYFVMGDNRVNSADSRVWGFLPRENIVGKLRLEH